MTYDGLFVDLDGVVYRSDRPVEHAIDALNRYEGQILYVTNNASRTPATVAAQLQGLGLAASISDVVTSAQAAAAHLAQLVPIGSPILVVGGEGLVEAVTDVGFSIVHVAEEADAVVQGFAPAATWKDLAEASYAVARGIPWVASNTDMSVPTSRGIAPGTGTYVAAVTPPQALPLWSPANRIARSWTWRARVRTAGLRWSSGIGWTPISPPPTLQGWIRCWC